jgi:hypothetical protein
MRSSNDTNNVSGAPMCPTKSETSSAICPGGRFPVKRISRFAQESGAALRGCLIKQDASLLPMTFSASHKPMSPSMLTYTAASIEIAKLLSGSPCDGQPIAGKGAPSDPQSTYTCILGGRGIHASQYAISNSVPVAPISNTHLTTRKNSRLGQKSAMSSHCCFPGRFSNPFHCRNQPLRWRRFS